MERGRWMRMVVVLGIGGSLRRSSRRLGWIFSRWRSRRGFQMS